MPRVSREQTDINRLAIEEASSRLFREQGIKAVSVADLMAAAGLTHGGFYGHFASKDALAAVACTNAFEQSAKRWEKRLGGSAEPAEALAGLFEAYLSQSNCNNPGAGCPIVGLGIDVAREPADKPIHAAYLSGLKQLLGLLTAAQGSGDAEADRSAALVQMSMLVGAMVLARATSGDTLSGEIREAARSHLVQAAAEGSKKSPGADKSKRPRPARH